MLRPVTRTFVARDSTSEGGRYVAIKTSRVAKRAPSAAAAARRDSCMTCCVADRKYECAPTAVAGSRSLS